MPLEPSFGNIDDLNPDWPLGTDPLAEGDDHIRGIKASLQGNVLGDATATQLLANALVLLATTANGIRIGVPGVVGRVAVEDNNDVEAATLDAAAGGVSLNALVEDVTLALNATPTGGGGVPVFTGDPNAAATLYWQGREGYRTTGSGGTVTTPAGTGAVTIVYENQDGAILTIQANGAAPTSFTCLRDGFGINLVGTDAGGAAQNLLAGDPDFGVNLYYQGIVTLSTIQNGIILNGNNGVGWTQGFGSPEGVVTAQPGSLYSDNTSGSAKPVWMKNFGAGNTGWLAIAFQP